MVGFRRSIADVERDGAMLMEVAIRREAMNLAP